MAGWVEKRGVMQRYDLTAHLYDMRYAQEQTSKMEVAVRNTQIGNEDLVLDVGCGTGLLFEYVADRAKMTVALDISRDTLVQAKERAKKFQNVHLILADAEHLPLKSGLFTHLYVMTVLQNVPNPVKTLEEAKRVVTEEGLLVVTGLKKKFTQECFEELLQDTGLTWKVLEYDHLNCRMAICT